MTVNTYSLKKDGAKKAAANFSVSEFACKDGSDKILLDDQLPQILQLVREHFGKPVVITSGYRTASHNAKVGGASSSQHLLGKAADFYASGVTPMEIAKYLEQLGAHGLGVYSSWVHVDVRDGRSYWDQRSGSYKSVSTFGGKPLYVDVIKQKVKIDDKTAKYLQSYQYGYALVDKLYRALR